jgi:hypothetical protein
MSDLRGPFWRGAGKSDGIPEPRSPRGKKKKPTSLGGGLASDLGERVLSQAGIEDGIGNLVAIEGEKVRIEAVGIEGFSFRGE